MRSHFLHPSPLLSPFVEAFVDLRLTGDESGEIGRGHRLLPAPGTSISIGYGLARGTAQLEGGPEAPAPLCSVSGYWTRPKTYRMVSPGGVFVVCFKPWGLAPFCRTPITELTDRSVDLAHAFGREVSEELADRIAESNGVAERKEIVEEVLLRLLIAGYDSDRPREEAEEAITLIAQAGGAIRVNDLAEAFGYGRKRLDRMFQRHIGWTPKKIARVIRFQRSLKLLPTSTSLAEAAHELGYFDQAHFIREFREMSGRTPGDYLRTDQPTDLRDGYARVIRSSHLYNTVYE